MSDTCAYCKNHNWNDHEWHHVCMADKDRPEKKCTDTCERFVFNTRVIPDMAGGTE